jgi:hypothetical protein
MPVVFRCIAASAVRALVACMMVMCCAVAVADEFEDLEDDALSSSIDIPSARSLAEELPPGREELDHEEFLDPDAAQFDQWDPIVKEGKSIYDRGDGAVEKEIRPFDWMRKWGFRHSSTDGRFVDKSVPLANSSWLNRPYHVDWFAGPLLTGGTISESVSQSNEMFGGLRLGWDFDYYWGLEWRLGWSDPELFVDGSSDSVEGDYFVSDVDLVYYPWGDTKVRPYFQLGLGVTQLDTLRDGVSPYQATLLSMPMGIGLQFAQTPWLAWRLEIINNLAFGDDDVQTMNNIAFTGGMEIRMGAKPNSYWPWRSSRTIW